MPDAFLRRKPFRSFSAGLTLSPSCQDIVNNITGTRHGNVYCGLALKVSELQTCLM